jgi:hypothetical protein
MIEPAMPMAKSGVFVVGVDADLLFCWGASGL